MLWLHETHAVVGKHEEEFEAAIRDEWMPTLAQTDDARLLYFMHHAHGTGLSYHMVTITALKNAAAWASLSDRIQHGDLQSWMRKVDAMRRDSWGKLLTPVYWSPLKDIDLSTVPTDGNTHDTSIFMEDTGWPYSSLDDYIKMWHEIYYTPMIKPPREQWLLDIQACFQIAHGAGKRREAILWQKILSPERYLGLITNETAAQHKVPGSYMHDSLEYRDDWESRILRTSPWSPWW